MKSGVVGIKPPCPGSAVLYPASGLDAAPWEIADAARTREVFVRFAWDRSDEDWTRLMDSAGPGCPHVELGNEPGEADYPAYFARVPALAKIVRASGRKAVLAAARSENTYRYLIAAGEANVFAHLDGVAIHPYAATPKEALGIIERGRRAHGRLPFHITEIGWSVDPGTTTGPAKAFVTTEHDQAEKARSVFRLISENAERLNIRRAFWFSGQDFQPNLGEKQRWIHRAGLYRLDGTARPALHAFEEVVDGKV